ncbi:MAG: hypothetical protein AAB019_03545 [Planctomycetota bacterium]
MVKLLSRVARVVLLVLVIFVLTARVVMAASVECDICGKIFTRNSPSLTQEEWRRIVQSDLEMHKWEKHKTGGSTTPPEKSDADRIWDITNSIMDDFKKQQQEEREKEERARQWQEEREAEQEENRRQEEEEDRRQQGLLRQEQERLRYEAFMAEQEELKRQEQEELQRKQIIGSFAVDIKPGNYRPKNEMERLLYAATISELAAESDDLELAYKFAQWGQDAMEGRILAFEVDVTKKKMTPERARQYEELQTQFIGQLDDLRIRKVDLNKYEEELQKLKETRDETKKVNDEIEEIRIVKKDNESTGNQSKPIVDEAKQNDYRERARKALAESEKDLKEMEQRTEELKKDLAKNEEKLNKTRKELKDF